MTVDNYESHCNCILLCMNLGVLDTKYQSFFFYFCFLGEVFGTLGMARGTVRH